MLKPEIEALLALPAAQALDALRALPEGQWFERKSGRIAIRDLAIPLVAMANAEGGYIAVGFGNGEIEPMTVRKVNDVRQAAVDFTEPPVRMTAVEIPTGDGALVVLRVEPGRRVHTTTGGDCYLRIGDESRKLGYAQRQQLEDEKGDATFESLPVDKPVTQLDQSRMAAYQRQIGSSTVPDMLNARDLLADGGQPTVAAWLLFADRPQQVFPEAYIRVLRYVNTFRGVGDELQLYDDGDLRFEGPLPAQLRAAERAIADWMPKRRALNADGRFGPIALIPDQAWREGLVNAVIHRSYGWAGDHIRVEIFPDRIEITNPGGLPGLGDAAKPLEIKRYARNPRIARVCAEMGIAQELGEGIRRMFKTMRDANLEDPVYSVAPTQVRLTLYMSQRTSEYDGLPATAQAIIQALRQAAAPLGTSQIAQLADVSGPTASRYLKQLQAAGIVHRQASSANDPKATWHLS
jgi:ATP-dependent DNA helicase RecG